MDRERLDKWCERGILGLVLGILVFAPLATGAVRPLDFLVIRWLTIPLVFLWVLRLWINPQLRIYWPPVCWGVLVFVVYGLVRYLTADLEYVARQESIHVLVYALLFLVVTQNLRSPHTSQIMIVAMIALAMAISCYAIYQYMTNSDRVWHYVRPPVYAERGSGTYICPNHLAGYLEMILPLALCYSLIGRSRPVLRIVLGYAALVILGGLMATVSRGGWIAAGLSLALLAGWLVRQRHFRVRGLVLLGVLAIGALAFLAKASFPHSRVRLFHSVRLSEDVRFILWKPAWRMWMDHFWFGVGPAHFDHRFGQYRPAHRDLQVRPKRVHNDYLNTLVDWGLIGGLLVLGVWVIFFRHVLVSWKKVQLAQDSPANWRENLISTYVGGTFGLVALLIHSIGDYNMHIPANAITAVTLMAVVSGSFQYAQENGWILARLRWRVLGSLLALGALIYLTRQNWVRTEETIWLGRAERLGACSDAQTKALVRAGQAEPANFQIPFQVGSCYRAQSWEGYEDYKKLAQEAMIWFERSSQLNPYDPYNYAQYGMCLDWVGKSQEAEGYFKRAHALDPNNYYIVALVGWHYLNAEDYAESKRWLEQSIRLYSADNFIAWFYLQHVNRRLSEQKKLP